MRSIPQHRLTEHHFQRHEVTHSSKVLGTKTVIMVATNEMSFDSEKRHNNYQIEPSQHI